MEQPTMSYLRPQNKGIKLHLGAGDYWMDGFLNIDHGIYGATDMIFDMREKLPFQDRVVEEIQAHDVIEHFNKYELDVMLQDWYRLLIDGGRVEVTTPDFEEVSKIENDEDRLKQLYGLEDNPGHKWMFTIISLLELFEKYNFKNIQVDKTVLEIRPGEPKLRLICQK